MSLLRASLLLLMAALVFGCEKGSAAPAAMPPPMVTTSGVVVRTVSFSSMRSEPAHPKTPSRSCRRSPGVSRRRTSPKVRKSRKAT